MTTDTKRKLVTPRVSDRAEVQGSVRCPNSGRAVSQARIKTSIYTDRGWIAYCPGCGHTAVWAMAELRPTGVGYFRRWKEHTK